MNSINEKILKKPEELGTLWCNDVVPAYEYVNNMKTDKIVGYKYALIAPEQGMVSFYVKVLGEKRLEVSGNYVAVSLVNSEFVPYVNKGRVAFSAKAADIRVVK